MAFVLRNQDQGQDTDWLTQLENAQQPNNTAPSKGKFVLRSPSPVTENSPSEAASPVDSMVKPPREKGYLESIGDAAHASLSKRGIGLIQTADKFTGGGAIGIPAHIYDYVTGNSGTSDKLREAIPRALENLNTEEKGTGVTGLLTGIAVDPINWMGGAGSVAKAGAITGGLGSLTAPSSNDAGVVERLKDSALGAGLGATSGKVIQYGGKKLSDIAEGIVYRVGSAFGSNWAADNIVYNKLAEKMLADGLTPDEVYQKIAAGVRSGVAPTLAEATGSRGAAQYEKVVASGAGKGATIFNKNLDKRGSDIIPGVIERSAAKLKGAPGAVDAAYDAAKAEGNATIANSIKTQGSPLAIAPPGGATAQPNLLDELSNTLKSVTDGVDRRLGELGKVNSIEAKALRETKVIMDNAKARGGSFEALLDAKKQLNDLYIDGADSNAQKAASRFAAKYTSQIDDVLSKLAPSEYPAAKTLAKSRMAGNELEQSLGDAKTGNIRKVVSDIWGSPASRQEFTDKLPDAATKTQYQELFDQLNNIAKGMGGETRAVNTGSVLPSDFRGTREGSFGPLGVIPAIVRNVGETFVPKLYERAAEAAWNPNQAALGIKMAKQLEGYPIARLMAGILGGEVGQGLIAEPVKPNPLKITVTKDPNIGADGLPRVNLP